MDVQASSDGERHHEGEKRAAAWNLPVPTLAVVRRMAVFSIPWFGQYAASGVSRIVPGSGGRPARDGAATAMIFSSG
jgi:hypothetical protein